MKHFILTLSIVFLGSLVVSGQKYNWKNVHVGLTDGRIISGRLKSINHDSLLLNPGIRIAGARIEYVAIHKKGSAWAGAFLGGVAGAAIGSTFTSHGWIHAEPYAGALLGAVIGAMIGSTNKKHVVHGDSQKFAQLADELLKGFKASKLDKADLDK